MVSVNKSIINIAIYVSIPFIIMLIMLSFKDSNPEWECESGVSMFKDTTNICRKKIEGGWMVINKNGDSQNPTFFPDKNHEWSLNNDK